MLSLPHKLFHFPSQGYKNAAEHSLVKGKGFFVQAAHPTNKIHLLSSPPPPPPLTWAPPHLPLFTLLLFSWNYGRFSYGSFRLLSVRLRLESIRLRVVSPMVCIRLRLESIRLRLICQFAYVVKHSYNS